MHTHKRWAALVQAVLTKACYKLATLGVELFLWPSRKEGSDLIDQVAEITVGATDGSSLAMKGLSISLQGLFRV